MLYTLKKQLHSLGAVDYLLQGKIAEDLSKGEIFKCNYEKAKEAIDEAIVDLEKNASFEIPDLYDILARNYT